MHSVVSLLLLLAASVLADDGIVKEQRHLIGQCDCKNGSRGQLTALGKCICHDSADPSLSDGQCRCGGLIGTLDADGLCQCDQQKPSEVIKPSIREQRHLLGQCDCKNGSRGQLAAGGKCICADDSSDPLLPVGQCRCGGLIRHMDADGVCPCGTITSTPIAAMTSNAGHDVPISFHLGSSNSASISSASVPQNLRSNNIVPKGPEHHKDLDTRSRIAIAASGTIIAVVLVGLMVWGIIALTKYAGTFT